MNSDQMKGKWTEMKGEVLNTWGKLTHDELDETKGNIGAIAGLIQQRYGEAKEAISDKLTSIFGSAKESIGETASNATEDAKESLRNTEPTAPNLSSGSGETARPSGGFSSRHLVSISRLRHLRTRVTVSPMLVIHHLNNSRSQRVLWLFEELELSYELRTYQRDARMLAPPELRAVHPLGKSPVLEDGSRLVVESAVILEYVLDHYGGGRMRPAAGDDFERYRYFMHYAEGSAMPPLVMKLVFEAMPRQPMPCFARPLVAKVAGAALSKFVNPEVRRHAEYLERELAARPWFAGSELSAADVQMSFPVEAMRSRGGENFAQRFPRLDDFLTRVHARPAYQRAITRGGPFEMLT